MMLGVRFEMRLKIPGQTGQLRHVVSAPSACGQARRDTGQLRHSFSLIDPPGEIREMIAALHHYFSFQPNAACAAGAWNCPPSDRFTDKDCCHGV